MRNLGASEASLNAIIQTLRTSLKNLQNENAALQERIAELEVCASENARLRQQIRELENCLSGAIYIDSSKSKTQQRMKAIMDFVSMNPGLTSGKIGKAIASSIGLKPASVKAYLIRMAKAGMLQSKKYMGPTEVEFNAWFVVELDNEVVE